MVDLRVEHVAEDLGGHHHDPRLPVEAEVAGEQPHVGVTELVAEVAQLLVGEGLERRCVEHLAAMGQGAVDGVLTHQGLARAGGGAHHHGMALVQGVDRLVLKGIEREGEQLLQGRHRSDGGGVVRGGAAGAGGHGQILSAPGAEGAFKTASRWQNCRQVHGKSPLFSSLLPE
jgi:hypothetical protein